MRDEWVFIADSMEQEQGMLVAEGSFERKRLRAVVHVPLTSVIYIEEAQAREQTEGTLQDTASAPLLQGCS